MRRHRWHARSRRTWLLAVAAIIVANGFFLVFNLLGALLPTEPVTLAVRTAFVEGELGLEDWLPFDHRLGFNQYNDCSILLMGLNREGPALQRAVGQRLTFRSERWDGGSEFCRMLYETVHEDPVARQYSSAAYSRYWHGYVPLTTTALQVIGVKGYRQVLRLSVAGALLLLLLAASYRSPVMMPLAASVVVVGALFWALPYYAPSPSHAPGDSFMLLGLAALMARPHRVNRPARFVPFCAVYGAGIMYLEFLTGQLPIAAGLLLPIAYLMATTGSTSAPPAHGWRCAAAGLLAFSVGVVLTVMIKQALVLTLLGPEEWEGFVTRLVRWTGTTADPRYPPPGDRLITPLLALVRSGHWLTYHSKPAAAALFASAAVAWAAAGWFALRAPAGVKRARSDFLAFAAGASVIAVWVFLLPTHTVRHTPWMVRILLVPIALGWAAFIWQWRLARGIPNGVSKAGETTGGSTR
jgi:hypothetical protein